MNKFIALSLAFTHCLGAVAYENSPSQPHVVNVNRLTEPGLQELLLGLHPDIIIEFSAPTVVPLSFLLKGDLVDGVEAIGSIEIKQTFYARYAEGELWLSADAADWKPFVEFITGTLSAGLNIQDGKPIFSIGLEVNRRT